MERRSCLVASRADLDHDRLLASLDEVDVASGARRTIVSAREDLSSPEWSPDFSRIAFIAPDASSNAQIYVIPRKGGAPSQVSHAATGVEQFAWRPDGRAFAYVALDTPPHKTGAARYRDAFAVGTIRTRRAADPCQHTSTPSQPTAALRVA